VILVASGDRTWFVGMVGSAIVLFVGVAAFVFVFHYRATIGRLRRMQRPEAQLVLLNHGFRITSDAGMSELPLNTISEAWCFPSFWLMLVTRSQFFTLPLADLSDEARRHILGRLKAHGVKIV
jgi:hypothetical protein